MTSDDKKPEETTPDAPADPRRYAPSSARNTAPILAAWMDLGPQSGRVLEIGSGTGEHAVAILRACPGLTWIASDYDETNHPSILAWARHESVADRLKGPIAFDAAAPSRDWGVDPGLAGIYCVNMIHISPWEAGCGVFRGAGELLAPGGRLFLYGPYRRHGAHVSPSNAEFEEWLKSLDPEFGVRDLEGEVMPEAHKAGLVLVEIRPMPSNNFVVVFEKSV